ncbi:Hypothetical protein CAP_2861 [Chondromyces apiculatus DSM 436]|uniref:Uncharacterized protein n=1 Tax=Chondromyces apiculatus DSM 436 TaxID=1192034 RepID=A0A017TAK4_9BACT|nr:Hypothetical protein CAP_2861 [Chondromyces apiculatus DSM 436]
MRERLLAAGTIAAEDIDAHTAGLPDLEGQLESLPFEQPALSAGGGVTRGETLTSTDDGLE